MGRTARWAWWHKGQGPDDYRIRELLRAIWDLHATYGLSAWLWRGQNNMKYDVTPAIHTRLGRRLLDDTQVISCTEDLLVAARQAHLDVHEDTRLPDMALLAMLQHHGAATPLLDVSLDPLVALYMAIVSTDPADDSSDGILIAVKKPGLVLPAFLSSSFADVYADLPDDSVALYTAPDVSERLRIQRGHFLIGRVATRFRTSIPLTLEDPSRPGGLDKTWIYRLMARRGTTGKLPIIGATDTVVFRIAAKFKAPLRTWLEERSGLTPDFVLPTAWHRPHLDAFCASHGRTAVWTPQAHHAAP
jgi:FRG domain